MPVLTSPATYYDGIVRPKIKPNFDVAETIVTFIPAANETGKERTTDDVFNKTFGMLPDLPDGVAYTRKIRSKWHKRFTRLWR